MDEIVEKVQEEGIEEIHLQFSDIHGAVKSVAIPSHKLDEALDRGVWFDGSSIEGFTRISESDMFLKPDPETYCKIPWRPESARLICDVFGPDGKPFVGDPRYILKKILREAGGVEYKVGPELEFFLFRTDGGVRPDPHDVAGYFDFSPLDLASGVKKEIVSSLEKMGIECETSHHEVAPGQHELDFKYGGALETADRVVTLKWVVKFLARKQELEASFMPKPVFGKNGNGMHVHQSLFRKGKNVFFEPDDRYRLSEEAYGFIAGQLKHARALAAVVAPTVNSYKRLVPGYEAPVNICWGQINRSALIRIPRYSEGREQSTRVELRCPDPSANPYLAFAVMLKAGMEGIKNKLKPPKPVKDSVYKMDENERGERGIGKLPGSLFEALEELEKDETIKKALGECLFRKYLEAKYREWKEYGQQVTEWEMERYVGV